MLLKGGIFEELERELGNTIMDQKVQWKGKVIARNKQ